MDTLRTMTYEVTGRIARITLNRPARGNGITFDLPRELAACVERADLNPAVHAIALAGNGKGFCGGYDLVASAERMLEDRGESLREAGRTDGAESRQSGRPAGAERDAGPGGSTNSGPGGYTNARFETVKGSALDPAVQARNHHPSETWDPMIDYQMMSRNVRGFMSLFHANKPVVVKVHGFCVAGGTDMALCADLIVIEDTAKIGYPPARVWGCPTSSMWAYRLGVARAKRLLFTGDCLSGTEAVEWGLAVECAPRDQLDERFDILLNRIARVPINQLMMMKLHMNQTLTAQGLHAAQIMGTVYDGITRHTKEGYAFQALAAEKGFKTAVHERDDPFGDFGPSTFKG